ncbi:MAG TPA: hypothetical protein VL443_20560 [Cyclobacteriaceae bacterium]|jgi:hypothetical protein|nr:hypothetical protein [Cyclobacteriaceae bacterium]
MKTTLQNQLHKAKAKIILLVSISKAIERTTIRHANMLAALKLAWTFERVLIFYD